MNVPWIPALFALCLLAGSLVLGPMSSAAGQELEPAAVTVDRGTV